MAALMTWSDLLAAPKPQPDRTVRTGSGETDIVDVWLPDGAGPHPTVLMIHGGCWQKSIADRTLMNYAADALRQEGLAVWNIEYRGVDEAGGGYPGTFLDVARGVDALGELGPGLGLETGKVAAFGHSAGGHLALWAAARHKLPAESPLYAEDPLPIAGVVNSGGLADLEVSAPVTQPGCLADILEQLVGAPSEGRPDVYSATSPAEMLPIGVRQISVNGAGDRIAPPILGESYTQKAAGAGDEAGVLIVPASGHVELIAPGTDAFQTQTALLKSILGLGPDQPGD
ncbi:MAG: alpha/beta hydrolase [Henriciella sp.]|uniref:alpha/beta hydrolase family protein n=1 Tax=Henriciella sp. TaxID=1968823 RepID=UPI003C7734C2